MCLLNAFTQCTIFRSIIELWGHGITHEDLFEDLRKSTDSVVIYSYSVIQSQNNNFENIYIKKRSFQPFKILANSFK